MKAKPTKQTCICPKCNGNTVIEAFYYEQNGICFMCKGSGYVTERVFSTSVAKEAENAKREAEQKDHNEKVVSRRLAFLTSKFNEKVEKSDDSTIAALLIKDGVAGMIDYKIEKGEVVDGPEFIVIMKDYAKRLLSRLRTDYRFEFIKYLKTKYGYELVDLGFNIQYDHEHDLGFDENEFAEQF